MVSIRGHLHGGNLPLCQNTPSTRCVSAPEAAGYELQSHGIIETLKLLDTFMVQRTVLVKTELHSKHAFDMSMQV